MEYVKTKGNLLLWDRLKCKKYCDLKFYNKSRFSESNLTEMKLFYQVEEFFYSNLNLEDISNDEYKYAKNVCNIFKAENLEDFHDLYFHSDTLLSVDIFRIFRDTCQNLNNLNTAHFLIAPGLAWIPAMKTSK